MCVLGVVIDVVFLTLALWMHRQAVWAEDDEQRRRRLQREHEEAEAAARDPVANQNLAFRR
jgi:hypothetical protein